MTRDRSGSPFPRTAADLMRRDVITISSEASVQELAVLISRHGISGGPAVDEEGDVVATVIHGRKPIRHRFGHRPACAHRRRGRLRGL